MPRLRACAVVLFAAGLGACEFDVGMLDPEDLGADLTVPGDLAGADLTQPLPDLIGLDLTGVDLMIPPDLMQPPDLMPLPPVLTLTRADLTADVNLTAEGTLDWSHYGLNSASDVNHKSPGGTIIESDIGGHAQFTLYPHNFIWSDGTPTASGNTNNGIYVGQLSQGYTLTVPASTKQHTLRVCCGQYSATSSIVAHLSDGSVPDQMDSRISMSSLYSQYTIVFRAASPGQTLSVTLTMTGGGGANNVDLFAATLF